MGAPIEAVRKYISSALINDIYIQMDKKRGKSVRVSRARSVDRSLQHTCLSLSLSFFLSRAHDRYTSAILLTSASSLRVISFVLNRFGGFGFGPRY